MGILETGLAVFGIYFAMKLRPKGSTDTNATYATLRRRIKYGGRKGRRAVTRMYGSKRKMLESPTLGQLLRGEQP